MFDEARIIQHTLTFTTGITGITSCSFLLTAKLDTQQIMN
jgi:hypothetical protein